MALNGNVMSGLIEQKLLNLHTAFLATTIKIDDNMAKIQPLTMIKSSGNIAQKQSVMTVPILKSIGCPIETGDTVLCLCCERDITQTRRGNFALPPQGHHRLTDAIIIGVI